jgi:hypothetical protein
MLLASDFCRSLRKTNAGCILLAMIDYPQMNAVLCGGCSCCAGVSSGAGKLIV